MYKLKRKGDSSLGCSRVTHYHIWRAVLQPDILQPVSESVIHVRRSRSTCITESFWASLCGCTVSSTLEKSKNIILRLLQVRVCSVKQVDDGIFDPYVSLICKLEWVRWSRPRGPRCCRTILSMRWPFLGTGTMQKSGSGRLLWETVEGGLDCVGVVADGSWFFSPEAVGWVQASAGGGQLRLREDCPVLESQTCWHVPLSPPLLWRVFMLVMFLMPPHISLGLFCFFRSLNTQMWNLLH